MKIHVSWDMMSRRLENADFWKSQLPHYVLRNCSNHLPIDTAYNCWGSDIKRLRYQTQYDVILYIPSKAQCRHKTVDMVFTQVSFRRK
jgi:hypothetical protein